MEASIVDQYVDATKLVHCVLHNLSAVDQKISRFIVRHDHAGWVGGKVQLHGSRHVAIPMVAFSTRQLHCVPKKQPEQSACPPSSHPG